MDPTPDHGVRPNGAHHLGRRYYNLQLNFVNCGVPATAFGGRMDYWWWHDLDLILRFTSWGVHHEEDRSGLAARGFGSEPRTRSRHAGTGHEGAAAAACADLHVDRLLHRRQYRLGP